MNSELSEHIAYKSIAEIRLRKAILLKDIEKDSNKVRNQWNSLFYKPTELNKNTPTAKRINTLLSTGAGVLDAFILGWKLYRRFRK
ncbi:MAG: hypothetical protein LIR46_13110 [Bacteroidota bacterium]|nr:hypothetical protein [Massilibacteroides sp.]MDT3388679.1 hypothetical protein [Bacteroidota bacterium]